MPIPTIEAVAGLLLRMASRIEQDCHAILLPGAFDDLLGALVGADPDQVEARPVVVRGIVSGRHVPDDPRHV